MKSRTPDPQVTSAPAPKSEKFAYSVDGFCEVASVRRSFAYQEIRAGRLIAQKAGSRTLITVENAKKYLANLPVVTAAVVAVLAVVSAVVPFLANLLA